MYKYYEKENNFIIIVYTRIIKKQNIWRLSNQPPNYVILMDWTNSN